MPFLVGLNMNWLQKISNDLLDDLFRNAPKPVKTDPPRVIPVTLTLYRGFDNLPPLENGIYTFSSQKCEQGCLWFSHKLINGYNPMEYVQGRGAYLMTYPLECKRHIEKVYYDDGGTYDHTPHGASDKEIPTDDCPFYAGYELPPGWFFSYKMEKFIICKLPRLEVRQEWVTEQQKEP